MAGPVSKPLFEKHEKDSSAFDLKKDAGQLWKHYKWNLLGSAPVVGMVFTLPGMLELKENANARDNLEHNFVSLAVNGIRRKQERGEWKPLQPSFGGAVSPSLHEVRRQAAMPHALSLSRMPSHNVLRLLRRSQIAANRGALSNGRLRLQEQGSRRSFTPVYRGSRPLFRH